MNIQLEVSDSATPILAELRRKLTDRTDLHRSIATTAEVLTRRYILEQAAPARHKTADRLGATPTGYLTRRGEAIESEGTPEAAIVRLGGAREIFARVDGDVPVAAVKGKYLTIPAHKDAYGRRARDFSDLKFVPFASGARALVRQRIEQTSGKRGKPVKKVINEPIYWLRESVLLPADRGLLPTDEQYLAAAEAGARDYLRDLDESTNQAAA